VQHTRYIKNHQCGFVAAVDCLYGQTTTFGTEMLIEAVVSDKSRQELFMPATAVLAV
jgi:hypothetical protein